MATDSPFHGPVLDAVREALKGLGYVEVEHDADFWVAWYASSRERLDVSLWDYGYPWRPGWWRIPGPDLATAVTYGQGTVIIDAIGGTTKEPFWRGSGMVRTWNDPARYGTDLTGMKPDAFVAGSFRSMRRAHGSKPYRVILGKSRADSGPRDPLVEQSYRCPISAWTEDEAREHCREHGGAMFEPTAPRRSPSS